MASVSRMSGILIIQCSGTILASLLLTNTSTESACRSLVIFGRPMKSEIRSPSTESPKPAQSIDCCYNIIGNLDVPSVIVKPESLYVSFQTFVQNNTVVVLIFRSKGISGFSGFTDRPRNDVS